MNVIIDSNMELVLSDNIDALKVLTDEVEGIQKKIDALEDEISYRKADLIASYIETIALTSVYCRDMGGKRSPVPLIRARRAIEHCSLRKAKEELDRLTDAE